MTLFFQSLEDAVPEVCRGGILTLGNFDGVHLGHQALLAETARQARALAAPAVAVTFDPHPQQLLRPDAFQPTLTTLEHRAELLHAHGAEHVVVFRLTPAFLQLGAREFFERIIRDGLGARGIVEGFNFGFGRGREGTAQTLEAWGQQARITVTLFKALELDGKPVSTSRVRNELLAGNVSLAQKLLDRPYRLVGTVGAGQKRGQGLGFPTANLDKLATLIPGNGVYAVKALHEGRAWAGAANIGPNPTFGETARKVEVHLIGFQGNLYDKQLTVDFVARIRDTRPFSGPAELIAQLKLDVERARRILDSV